MGINIRSIKPKDVSKPRIKERGKKNKQKDGMEEIKVYTEEQEYETKIEKENFLNYF